MKWISFFALVTRESYLPEKFKDGTAITNFGKE